MEKTGFLGAAPESPEAQALFDEDAADLGYVMNSTRLWAYQPGTVRALFDLMRASLGGAGFTHSQRAVLVAATASSRRDSYCSLAWGSKLAAATTPAVAAAVINADEEGLTGQDKAMADWARRVVQDPNAITAQDVQVLRDAGFDDAQLFAMTVFVALRLAFSSVNDALGATPDVELHRSVPSEVAAAVDFGRPPDAT